MIKIGFNLDIIRCEGKIVFIVSHEVPYSVTITIYFIEGYITQTIHNFEEFKEKHSID